MSQHVISIRDIIAIALTMAERTDFVDRPAPSTGAGLSMKSVLSAMVSAIAIISWMLINVGNRIIFHKEILIFSGLSFVNDTCIVHNFLHYIITLHFCHTFVILNFIRLTDISYIYLMLF